MKKVLSKEEFVKKVLADLPSNKIAKAIPKKLKRKYSWKSTKYNGFEVVERTAVYA